VGFESAERMRRAFVRLYGNPPQAVRRIAERKESGGYARADSPPESRFSARASSLAMMTAE